MATEAHGSHSKKRPYSIFFRVIPVAINLRFLMITIE